VENCTDLQLPDIEYNKNHLNAIDAKLIKLIKVNHNCIFLMFFSKKTICEKSPTSLTHIIKPCTIREWFSFTGRKKVILLKGYSTQKWKFCHHLLTLKFFCWTQSKIFWRTVVWHHWFP